VLDVSRLRAQLLGHTRLAARQERGRASSGQDRGPWAGRESSAPCFSGRAADAFAPAALGALSQWLGPGAGSYSPATVGCEQAALAGGTGHQSVRRIAIRPLCLPLERGPVLESAV